MFKSFLPLSINFVVLFFSSFIFSNLAQAFFESQIKYDFENRWLFMLSDNSSKNRFKAMRSFLVYPEWGLPVLRNSMKNTKIEKNPWQVGALIGILGDSSDVPYLLKYWTKLKGGEKSEVFLGAIKKIYRRQIITEKVKPKLLKFSVKFLGKELSKNSEEKNFLIHFVIENQAKSNILLRVDTHFWGTISNENVPSEYFWLNPGEQIESKIKTLLIPSDNSNNIRLDLKVLEGISSEKLIHRTINIPI